MLEDLKDGQVHWKGKSLDCESFAQACPDCDNCSKDIKQALKNMQEEKVSGKDDKVVKKKSFFEFCHNYRMKLDGYEPKLYNGNIMNISLQVAQV